MANLKEAFQYAAQNPTSDFAKKLEALAGSGSLDQEAKKYGIDLTPFKPKVEQPSQMSRLGTDLLNRAKTVGEQVKQVGQAEGVAETAAQVAQTPLRVVGQAAGAVGDVIGAGVNAATGGGLDKLGEYIASTETGKQLGASLLKLQQEQPELAGTLGDLFNIATVGVGGVAAKPVVKAGVTGLERGAKATMQGITDAADVVVDAASTLRPITENITALPRRISANIAEKQATEEVIQSLPTKTAQIAARDGVDIADINTLLQLQTENKGIYKPLIEEVRKFSSGLSNADPIEQVGKPIVQQLKKAEAERKVVGKELGEVAKNLGVVTKPELESAVASRLVNTPGLEGLKIKNGTLDFSDTSLASSLSKSDQKAIQQAYSQATKWGDGRKAHLFRQELFEVLGGKKRSTQALTDTQEKAFEAIRSGLSDVLETKNPQYKKLSTQYRELIQPLQEMRKLSKTLDPNASDDILDLSAGLLARRLTSNAASNPKIRETLKLLDSATSRKGASSVNTESLINLYNVLDRYYDIAAKTGFKGQIQSAASPLEAVMGSIKGVAGTTPAVRQKALEDLLNELIK